MPGRRHGLVVRFGSLIRDGVVANQAEIAKLGFVSRARVSQICGLLNLAPEIQEALLFLLRVERGRDPVTERELRAVVAEGTEKVAVIGAGLPGAPQPTRDIMD